MKYTAPVAELLALEAVSVIMSSGGTPTPCDDNSLPEDDV